MKRNEKEFFHEKQLRFHISFSVRNTVVYRFGKNTRKIRREPTSKKKKKKITIIFIIYNTVLIDLMSHHECPSIHNIDVCALRVKNIDKRYKMFFNAIFSKSNTMSVHNRE